MKNKLILGLTLDEPSLIIPWTLTEMQLSELQNRCEYKKVADHYYYVTAVTLFDKQFCGDVGFHFNYEGKLQTLELNSADIDYSSEEALLHSFKKVQKTLEVYFGKPSKLAKILYFFTKTNRQNKECVWNFKKVKLIHTLFDRFGMEQRLLINIKGVK